MIPLKQIPLISIIVLSLLNSPLDAKTCLLTKKDCDIEIDFWGFFRPELFAGKNFTFLNNHIPEDVIFYFRHTNDYFLDLLYGKETYGYPVAEFKTSVRNRAVWGSPIVAQTLPAEAPLLNAEVREHHHALPRLFFWMREVWLQVGLTEFLGLTFANKHYLTVGAFPFELGRGISLGAAYAIGPGPLGFYSDAMIDQYAFGVKLFGDIIPETLKYDLYGALLQSRSNSLEQTLRPVLRQEIGRRDHPARGFGKDNYLVAARLLWTAFNDDRGTATIEPYILYNNDPEQRVEFVADSDSKLMTAGLAGEYINGAFECGFDTAFNRGRQFVKPWDRNQIITHNFDGQVVLVNSQVLMDSTNQFNGQKAPEAPNSIGQKAINNSSLTGTADQNGQLIEGAQNLPSLGYAAGPLSLQNSAIRFRTDPNGNGYSNRYKGWMFVADASYWVYNREFQIAGTFGYASGDQDPNFTVKDGDFKGFVGLQEVYAGKRVKSVFLLGTVGKVKRPGTQPENPLANKDFASSASGFTNLGFVGAGCSWMPASCAESKFVWNPNLFVYWEPSPGKKFDALTGKDLPEQASKFLGVEINGFLSYYPFASLKCFAIGSVFLPGTHFKDIRGKPLTPLQKRALENYINNPKRDPALIPNIGDDTAYTVNIGMEFTF
jgi:hypothetical protein